MSFNRHTNISGQHAFLSPSKPTWLDYDEDKLRRVYFQKQQTQRGTELHEFARMAINLGIKQAEDNTTLSMYINDAIGFRMTPEVTLFYSPDCFGTTDACGYNEKTATLRIHDLKTGFTPGNMNQLLVYAGLFCYEYKFHPAEITIVLRIYQSNAIEEMIPQSSDMLSIMSRIKTQAALVAYLREED